jgi:hypothetical protein
MMSPYLQGRFFIEVGDLLTFFSGLTTNLHPPDPHPPSSCNYKHTPPCPASVGCFEILQDAPELVCVFPVQSVNF